ncbi:MAG: AAA family ATPase, partial [Thermoanaerobaculia bacterium]
MTSLLSKMNETTRKALEDGLGLCLARTHYDIEVEHFLMKLLDRQDSDFHRVLQHFSIDKTRLTGELSRSLDKLKTGNGRKPAFSPSLVKAFTAAWSTGSLDYSATQIRSGFVVLALVSEIDLRRMTHEASRELDSIDPETLRRDLTKIVAGSPEEGATEAAAAADVAQPRAGKTPHLDQYTINLTENARAGKIDNVLGRDSEIRQIVDILTRRRQNNPILTGEAGVGKTAVVEGFALRVTKGDVPQPLRNVTVRTLDLALLQAGAGVKGEFENRLKGLVEEVKKSPTPIILFIDEAHTMIG